MSFTAGLDEAVCPRSVLFSLVRLSADCVCFLLKQIYSVMCPSCVWKPAHKSRLVFRKVVYLLNARQLPPFIASVSSLRCENSIFSLLFFFLRSISAGELQKFDITCREWSCLWLSGWNGRNEDQDTGGRRAREAWKENKKNIPGNIEY